MPVLVLYSAFRAILMIIGNHLLPKTRRKDVIHLRVMPKIVRKQAFNVSLALTLQNDRTVIPFRLIRKPDKKTFGLGQFVLPGHLPFSKPKVNWLLHMQIWKPPNFRMHKNAMR